jgi:hypothetical protein
MSFMRGSVYQLSLRLLNRENEKPGHVACGEDEYSYLTTWSRVLIEKLLIAQLVKKLPAFH